MTFRFCRAAAGALLLAFAPSLARATDPDPVDFLFRMGMLEGHLMVGRELIDAGQARLALPHFGHPVSELYDDIRPWLEARNLPAFDVPLVRLEAAVASAPEAPATLALYDQVVATVHQARLSAPQAMRDSIPQMIRICSDTVDAAAGEYGQALNRGKIDGLVEYHDSRGYLSFIAQEVDRMTALAVADDNGLVSRFAAVLTRARWITEPLMPVGEPRATVGQYRIVAADAAKVASGAVP